MIAFFAGYFAGCVTILILWIASKPSDPFDE